MSVSWVVASVWALAAWAAPQAPDRSLCHKDQDCELTRFSCGFCGRCPDEPPYAIDHKTLVRLQAECEANPARLQPVACSPCPPPNPAALIPDKPVCREGRCLAVGDPRCHQDSDCDLNPVDCSVCGHCPGDPPSAVLKTQIDMLRDECAKHPPARLNPDARALGPTAPACSPCEQGPLEPRILWRPVCRAGVCGVEQAGVAGPSDGNLGPTPQAAPDAGALDNVHLEIQAPFSHASIRVDSDGNLEYEATSQTPVQRAPVTETKSLRVTRERAAALFKALESSSLFVLQRPPMAGQDCASWRLALQRGGRVRSFSCRCSCPPDLDRIQAMLEGMLGQAMRLEGF